MTTTNRDAALDEASIPQPKPSASKLSVPVLHGITLNQLEATRGYTNTCAAIDRLHANVGEGIKRPCRPTLVEVDVIRVELERVSRGHEGDTSPYGDGVRYALSTARGVAQLREVEERIQVMTLGCSYPITIHTAKRYHREHGDGAAAAIELELRSGRTP